MISIYILPVSLAKHSSFRRIKTISCNDTSSSRDVEDPLMSHTTSDFDGCRVVTTAMI